MTMEFFGCKRTSSSQESNPTAVALEPVCSKSKPLSCTSRSNTCTMFAHTNLISCNFSSPQNPKIKPPYINTSTLPLSLRISDLRSKVPQLHQRIRFQICLNSMETRESQDADLEQENSMKTDDGISGGGGSGGDWTTSFLIFVMWGGLMYYVFNIAPNQTPSTDMYLLKKLLNLIGDDGFQLNQVIVSLWYLMGLWPLLYSMLLLPSARSSKGKFPVAPFLILSFFGGAYALVPYFVLWRPPPPPTEESELKRWPLNFLESKLTAGITFAAGLGLIVNAGLSSPDIWKEYFQYFGGSKLIHVTSIDFTLLSTFAPFWVYNDMTARKWTDKGFWLLPLSLIPFLGPALYVLLRPLVPAVPAAPSSQEK